MINLCRNGSIEIFEEDKKIYIEELKKLIDQDEQENNINLKVASENYFEFEFKSFKNFNGNINDNRFTFEFAGHLWGLFFMSGNNDKLCLKILNSKKDEPVLTKFIVAFHNVKNIYNNATLNVSSLYCFNGGVNTFDRNSWDDYTQEINCTYYLNNIKPLTRKNKIMVGIYLRIYSKCEIKNFMNQLKKYMTYDNDYFIVNQNIYERVIEDWVECGDDSYKRFILNGYEWELKLFKNFYNSSYSVKLTLNTEDFDEDEAVIVNTVFYIRNDNNFSCVKTLPNMKCIQLTKWNNTFDYGKNIEGIDLLIKNPVLNKAILENNKL